MKDPMPARSRKPLRAPSAVANPGDVAEFAKGLSDAKLICRMNRRHIQDPRLTTVHFPTRTDPYHVMEGPCIICGQPVRRKFDEDCGRVGTSTTIGYDDDYLMPRGSGRIDANGSRMFVAEFMERHGGTKTRRRRTGTVTPIKSAKGA